MAKRLTDSDKWRDDWFHDLPLPMKMFWIYLLDTCDCAGIWKMQFKQFKSSTGVTVTEKDLQKHFSERLFLVNKGAYLIPKYIEFQYPNFNPDKNNAHKGAVKCLEYHGVTKSYIEGLVYNNKISLINTVYQEGLRSLPEEGIGIGLSLGLEKGVGSPQISSEEFFKGITL